MTTVWRGGTTVGRGGTLLGRGGTGASGDVSSPNLPPHLGRRRVRNTPRGRGNTPRGRRRRELMMRMEVMLKMMMLTNFIIHSKKVQRTQILNMKDGGGL